MRSLPRRTEGSPRDTISYFVKYTQTMLPGGDGRAVIVVPTESLSFSEQEDDDLDVFDMKKCNCYFPGELGEVTYDGEMNRFIPVGSYGLLRRAKVAISPISSGGTGVANIMSLNGGVIVISLAAVKYRWADNAPSLAVNTEVWVQWLTDEQSWEIVPSGDGSGSGSTIIRVKPTAVLQPGENVEANVQVWDGDVWTDSTGPAELIEIYDPKFQNCVLTNEWCDVVLMSGSSHYEIVGSQGLTRIAAMNVTLAIDTSGAASFKSGGSTVFTADVHLNWMHGGEQISNGSEILALWQPDEERWLIIGAECEA